MVFLFLLLECECNAEGSVDLNCDAEGKCTCKENITGDKCDEVVPGYYDFPDPKRKLDHMSHSYLIHNETIFK